MKESTWAAVLGLATAASVAGCGGSSLDPANDQVQGGAGGEAAGVGAVGSGAQGGSAGSAAPGGGAGPWGGPSDCTPTESLKHVHTAPSDPLSSRFWPIGLEGGYLYFQSDDQVLRYPTLGGSVETIGTFAGSPLALHEGTLYGTSVDDVDPVDNLVAAELADLDSLDTLVYDVQIEQLVADDTGVYFFHRDQVDGSPVISTIPAGELGEETLVADVTPRSMLAHEGYLYWLDDDALERVPVAGGPRERLAEAPVFSGKLAASGDSLYWLSSGVYRFAEGATTARALASSPAPAHLAVEGETAFWVSGAAEGCGSVHQVGIDGSGERVIAQSSTGALWIAATAERLFVFVNRSLYQIDR